MSAGKNTPRTYPPKSVPNSLMLSWLNRNKCYNLNPKLKHKEKIHSVFFLNECHCFHVNTECIFSSSQDPWVHYMYFHLNDSRVQYIKASFIISIFSKKQFFRKPAWKERMGIEWHDVNIYLHLHHRLYFNFYAFNPHGHLMPFCKHILSLYLKFTFLPNHSTCSFLLSRSKNDNRSSFSVCVYQCLLWSQSGALWLMLITFN